MLSRVGKANSGCLLRHGDGLEMRYALVKRGEEWGGENSQEDGVTRVRTAHFDVDGEWELRIEHAVLANSCESGLSDARLAASTSHNVPLLPRYHACTHACTHACSCARAHTHAHNVPLLPRYPYVI